VLEAWLSLASQKTENEVEPISRRPHGVADTAVVRIGKRRDSLIARRGGRLGIDERLRHAVAVGSAQGQAEPRVFRQHLGEGIRISFVSVLQHEVRGDLVAWIVVETVHAASGLARRRADRPNPARTRVHTHECALCGRQIRVDVKDAVDVLCVQQFRRADDPHRQLAVHRDVRAPDLWELEIGIGHVERIAQRAGAGRLALVLGDICGERERGRGPVDDPLADKHARVTNLV
jgi:hypothetical protein